jgi:hypothetical protein
VDIRWQAVAETRAFSADADEMLSREEREAVITEIALSPDGGDLIPGAAGLRKRRIPLSGRGKRGGARVVTLYLGKHFPVYAVFLFAKNDRADLSASQRKRLATIVDDIREQARKRPRR